VPVGRAALAGRGRPAAEAPRPRTEDQPSEPLDDWDDWRTPLPPTAAPAPATPEVSRAANRVVDDLAFAPPADHPAAALGAGPWAPEPIAVAVELVDEVWAEGLGALVINVASTRAEDVDATTAPLEGGAGGGSVGVDDGDGPAVEDNPAAAGDRAAEVDDETTVAALAGREAEAGPAGDGDELGRSAPPGPADASDAPAARDAPAREPSAVERGPEEGAEQALAERRGARSTPAPARSPASSSRGETGSNGTSSSGPGRPRTRQRQGQRRLTAKEQAAESSSPSPDDPS
jgi:hypothetical protein